MKGDVVLDGAVRACINLEDPKKEYLVLFAEVGPLRDTMKIYLSKEGSDNLVKMLQEASKAKGT